MIYASLGSFTQDESEDRCSGLQDLIFDETGVAVMKAGAFFFVFITTDVKMKKPGHEPPSAMLKGAVQQ